MSTRTRSRPHRPQHRQPPVVKIALGAVVVVLAVGVALALLTSDEDGGGPTGREAVFAPVSVEGDPLPTYQGGEDPAVGRPAPHLTGEGPDRSILEVGGSGEPTLVAFLAHWCPHCQAELPLLVDLAEAGALDGVRLVAVLTGSDPAAPNFPPVAWLEREGWSGEVLLDDEGAHAAAAYGLAGYPFLVALDAEGTVAARASGELPGESVLALVQAASG